MQAKPAEQEERAYRSARGNLYSLRAYVNACQICAYKSEALDEIRNLETNQLTEEEATSYQNARGEIDRLRAYVNSCQICAFKSAALTDIRDLENNANYFSFEVCNSTGYVSSVAVVGRKNADFDQWTVEGWSSVSPNSCSPIGRFAKGRFYSMATVRNDSRGWYGGDTKQCVEFPSPFEAVIRANNTCGANGKVVGFQEFNVTGDPFTWRLTRDPDPEPSTSESPKHWLHNGSSFDLVTTGNRTKLVFTVVRPGLREVGVQPDAVIFEGTQNGQSVEGTAYVFSKTCGAVPYSVKGHATADERRIVLNGLAPYVDAKCTPVSYHDSTMEFERAE